MKTTTTPRLARAVDGTTDRRGSPSAAEAATSPARQLHLKPPKADAPQPIPQDHRLTERGRRVTKVTYDGKRVRIEYQVVRAGTDDPDEFGIVCNDRPARSLLTALGDLQEHVAGAAVVAILALGDGALR